MTSPTQRTLDLIRKRGWVCGIVERFIPQAGAFGKRIDFLHCFDIIAVSEKEGIIGIQSCGQDYSGHVNKLLSPELHDNLTAWLRHGKAELIGWRKVKLKRGGKAMRWKPRIGDVLLRDGVLVVEERS